MSHSPEQTIVTVSKETHDAFYAHNRGVINTNKTIFHADGSVSFHLSKAVLDELQNIHPDVEAAIRAALGVKSS